MQPHHLMQFPTMRSMTDEEIDAFLAPGGFAILSLAWGNRAYGVPLFFGSREGAAYFQTRQGQKSRYLYATTEACLTVSRPREQGEWASVQLMGRLERVDALSARSPAQGAIVGVPPPLDWADGDARADEPQGEGITTFRLVPTRRVGRYSAPPLTDANDTQGY